MSTPPPKKPDDAVDGNADPYWLDRRDNERRTHYRRRPSRHEWRRERLLKDWYGDDAGRMEIQAHQHPAKPLGEVIADMFPRSGFKEAAVLDQIRDGWESIVGADVARFAVPAALRDGVLNVDVLHASWLYVLKREHLPRIKEKVLELSGGAIHEVRLVPAGRNHTGNWRKRSRGPRDQ